RGSQADLSLGTTLGSMDDERWEQGMPLLDRQAVAAPRTGRASAAALPPSLQGLPPRSVPETAPTPLQKHYVLLSVPVLGLGPIARSTAIRSGGGVPPWLAGMLNYCSRCGTELTFGPIEGEDRDRLGCASCGHIAYVNPRLVVTTIPVTDAGEVVLLRRGIEPGKGWWAQPGGFLEVDETVGEAAVRETLEETG